MRVCFIADSAFNREGLGGNRADVIAIGVRCSFLFGSARLAVPNRRGGGALGLAVREAAAAEVALA